MDYNRNAAEKLEAYNSNHAAKVAEYNQNAAALQTEVDRLRGECDTLAAENWKQENRISALLKLNKGQTYDILSEEGEAASRTAPSGAKYVSVDKVGGKSVVWNQKVNTANALLTTKAGVTLSRNENGKLFLNGTATGGAAWCIVGSANLVMGHKYLSKRVAENVPVRIDNATDGRPALNFVGNLEVQTLTAPASGNVYTPVKEGGYINSEIDPFIIDLTLMFGAGNEPTAEQFERMFPEESHPYNPGEIISSRTETITAGVEAITTGFPELHSAGTAYDEIDMDGGQVIRSVNTVKLETLVWKRSEEKFLAKLPAKAKPSGNYNLKNNELCNTYEPMPLNDLFDRTVGIATHPINGETVWIYDNNYETPEQLLTSLSGAVLQYELATSTTEQVTIPDHLQEWLPVEPGGTVAFLNADESKQLAVPNGVSWVRKLDEVE